MVNDPDTEMAFVRQLSVHGLVLSGTLSAEDKRERIRVAILTHRLEGKCFAWYPNDHGETYGEAYRRCYGKALDQRRVPRDRFGKPIAPVIDLEDEDDDDEGAEPALGF